MLDFGVINNQEKKIVDSACFLLQGDAAGQSSGLQHQVRGASPVAQKYAIITLQFVLQSKSETQWSQESNVLSILSAVLEKCSECHGDAVQRQAVKSLCMIFRNQRIGRLPVVRQAILEFVERKLTMTMQSVQVQGKGDGLG